MTIVDKISDGFDTTMDWAMEGNALWSVTKILGIASLATAVLASPFMYVSYQNAKALEHRIEELDTRPTHIFNSVSNCTEMGYSKNECQSSQKEALDIAGELGTTLKYSAETDCITSHGECKKVVTPVTTTTMVGKIAVPHTTYYTNYHPAVVAWQAAQSEIGKSVPLYQSSVDGTAVRVDGAEFNYPKL